MIEEKYNLRNKFEEHDPKERVLTTMFNQLIVETKANEILLLQAQNKTLNEQTTMTLEKKEILENEIKERMKGEYKPFKIDEIINTKPIHNTEV